MKNILAKSLIICLSAIMLQSCKKFLDKKSDTSLSVPTTLIDMQALLDDNSTMNARRTAAFSESSTDDYFLLESKYNSLVTIQQNIYKWVPNQNTTYSADWPSCYNPVYNANLCLEGLGKIPLTGQNEAAWNNVKGSALFYRAYYFLQLVWTHSFAYDENTSETDLGIVLRTVSDPNVPSIRASVKDSYMKVIDDAKESIAYLPDNPFHVMRPSKAAAYSLLARTYLSMRIYDSAWKYANMSLQTKNQLINYNGDADINGNLNNASPFKAFNKEVIFHTTTNIRTQLHLAAAGALVDSNLYASYANNDLRKKAFFAASGVYFRFKGNYAASSTDLFSGLSTDEMFLIRAEGAARMGNKDAALSDLNTLLAKRYDATFIPVTASNANEALNRIIIERRKELLFRGLRFIEIKRLNKEGANITPKRVIGNQTYILLPNANYYALPLPEDIITLTGMPQNPQ
jgi:starch-binding outer membrane protein, SusD/RagB family